MQALIDFLIRNLLALWPIARVYDWQVAARIRKGRIREELTPGLHWRWWFVDEVKTYPRTEQVVDVQAGAVTTTDGQSVVVSANIGYTVQSLGTLWRRVWNVDSSIKALAAGRILSDVAQRSWEDLHGNARADLEATLRAAINSAVSGWGVTIERVHLTDCVKSRAHRVYLDKPL